MHLVGFIIRIYHDARSSECKNPDMFPENIIITAILIGDLRIPQQWLWRWKYCLRCESKVHLLTYPWEADSFSASQEISRILWKLKVHCRVHKKLPSSLTWARSFQSIPPYTSWRPILTLSSHLRLCVPSGLISLKFPYQNSVCSSPLPIVPHAPPISFFSISSPV